MEGFCRDTCSELLPRGVKSSSDFMLWGSAIAVPERKRGGRAPVASPISIITRVGKTRPGVLVRFLFPWYVEEAGWEIGQKLSFDMYDGREEGISDTYAGWVDAYNPDWKRKGYRLLPLGRSLHAYIIVSLKDHYPYFPAAVPAKDVAAVEDKFVCFTLPDPGKTIGDARAEAWAKRVLGNGE